MLRKTVALSDTSSPEKIQQSNYISSASSKSTSKHIVSVRNTSIKQCTSRDTWISQLMQPRVEIKRDDDDDDDTNNWFSRCSTIRVIRFVITFLLVGIVAPSQLLRSNSNNWRLKYRNYMNWNISDNEKSTTNSIAQLLSKPQWSFVMAAESEYVISCNVTTDVRGNLGPASVLLQNQTEDWIKDRWQAASDMHGTNIHGQHHVQLDWSYNIRHETRSKSEQQHVNLRTSNKKNLGIVSTLHQQSQIVTLQRIVLDWEAAYSDNYDIQIWDEGKSIDTTYADTSKQPQWFSIFTMRPTLKKMMKREQQQQHKINDATTATTPPFITTGGIATASEWGQSPGVTFTTPLHVMHDITLLRTATTITNDTNSPIRSSISLSSPFPYPTSKMRIVIHTSATGWGVSLWQVQVYGNYVLPNM